MIGALLCGAFGLDHPPEGGYQIDGKAGSIGGREGGEIGVFESKAEAKMFGECLLMDEDFDGSVLLLRPFESLAEEEVSFAHEIDFDFIGKEALETILFGF